MSAAKEMSLSMRLIIVNVGVLVGLFLPGRFQATPISRVLAAAILFPLVNFLVLKKFKTSKTS